ncbi:MAG: cytochrome b [Granulosicoccaceae bacterium]|jgi:cytochrome b561
MQNNPAPLSKLTIRLHWLVAAGMITLFFVGQYMSKNDAYSLYPTHKSVGMLILLLVLPRVVLRVIEGWPKPVGDAPAFQELIARLVHWALILATLAMPISGMLMSAGGGHGLAIFGLELLAATPDTANPGKFIPLSENMQSIGHFGHEIWSKVLAISVVLHVAGALKHHIKDKDATLTRMLGR